MVNKPPPDFKRKKVKVGRKVKRENVTKISLAAKKVHVPLQHLDASRSLESEDTRVSQISKQLHHYSSTNRVGALHELKQIFSRGEYTVKHIAIVLPSAMELLFDVEKDTRQALKDLIVYLVQHFDTLAFVSIRNIIVTYCCSGLTHLEKDIRIDSLQVIQHFTPTHVFQHDIEKIISHILTLLHDRDILTHITVAAKKPPLLVLCLQVIASILHPQPPSANSNIELTSAQTTGVHFIYSINSCSVSSPAPLAATTCTSLLQRFQYFWTSLTLGERNISYNNIQLLNLTLSITALLTKYTVFTQQPEFASLVHVILRNFPYNCSEVQQSINISISTKQLLTALRTFNLNVCSLFYQYVTACPTSKHMDVANLVQEYVKRLLHDMISEDEDIASDASPLFNTLQMQIAYDIQHGIATNTVDILRDLSLLLQRAVSPNLRISILDIVGDIFHNDFLYAELSQQHLDDVFELGQLVSPLPLLADIDECVVRGVLGLVLLIVQRHTDVIFATIPQYYTENVYGKFSSSRTVLLSIFYYASVENLYAVAHDVCNCVAKYRCDENEAFLMKLIFSRRTELQLSQFLQLTTDYYLLCTKYTSAAQLENLFCGPNSTSLHIAARRLVDVYHWCSSNASPMQLLQVLLPLLNKMVNQSSKKSQDRQYALLPFLQTLLLHYLQYVSEDTKKIYVSLLETMSLVLISCTIHGADGGIIIRRLQSNKMVDLTMIVFILTRTMESEDRIGAHFFAECKKALLKADCQSRSEMLKNLHSFLFAVKQYENYNDVFEDAGNMLVLLKNDASSGDIGQIDDILRFIE